MSVCVASLSTLSLNFILTFKFLIYVGIKRKRYVISLLLFNLLTGSFLRYVYIDIETTDKRSKVAHAQSCDVEVVGPKNMRGLAALVLFHLCFASVASEHLGK